MSAEETPRPPQLTPEDIAELHAKVEAGEIRLTSGHHDVTSSGQACAMDLILWRATGVISDTHECVHPIISSWIHGLNDGPGSSPESRWELVEHAGPAILGTGDLNPVHATYVILGAHTGAELAENIAVLRASGATEVWRRWMLKSASAPASSSGTRAPASSSGTRAPASSSGYGAPASSSGTRAPASSSGYGAPASSSGYGAPASSSGTRAPASSSGERSPAVALGGGMVRCGPEGFVVAVWFDSLGRPRAVLGHAGEDVEPNVWYRAAAPGVLEVVPVDECPTDKFMRTGWS